MGRLTANIFLVSKMKYVLSVDNAPSVPVITRGKLTFLLHCATFSIVK